MGEQDVAQSFRDAEMIAVDTQRLIDAALKSLEGERPGEARERRRIRALYLRDSLAEFAGLARILSRELAEEIPA